MDQITQLRWEEMMTLFKGKQELKHAAKCHNSRMVRLSLVAMILYASSSLPMLAASGQILAHNTPGYVVAAKSLGSEDPTKIIEVSIWLNPHNRGELDALAKDLYDSGSPNYRHFLSRSEFAARFAPTADEAKTVEQFFESHNLQVVKVASHNFFVRARGSVADVESAFHVQLNSYQVGQKILRANDRDPYIDGPAAAVAKSVAGLDTGGFEHPLIARATIFPNLNFRAAGVGSKVESSKPKGSKSASNTSDFYTNSCFGVVTETFSTNNDGQLPIGTYSGNYLNLQSLTGPGCAYTPPEIQTAYNLTGLYKQGYDGTGQTIGIINACGSPTILSDANKFSAHFGLPALTSSNFTITYIPAPSACLFDVDDLNDEEIHVDVEWAHAIAPGARIDLIVTPSLDFQDIDEAEYIAIDSGLANVISGSYGAVEALTAESELDNGNLISEVAAVLGISTNFSSGDCGDESDCTYVATVQYPADSPYATAVGGVTLALEHDNSIAWQAGWGNNEILLAQDGYVADPPVNFGFTYGAGGGPSDCVSKETGGYLPVCLAGFPKPAYQKRLPGKYRQLPDVSWLADPFTPAVVLITVPDQVPGQVWQTYGGTSLACPMFSALWAIANQEAETPPPDGAPGPPLGQAAPYLYSMPSTTIFDIVPQTSKTNVTASIREPTTTYKYTADEVAQVTGPFIDAIFNPEYDEYSPYVITFGTDSSLKTTKGWDNVTGVGSPNGKAFADYFHPIRSATK